MSLQKKLSKHGNSYSLIIDKALIDLLGINVEEPLDLSTPDGSSLVIRQPHEPTREERIRQSAEKLRREYGDVLKRLAE